VTTSLCLVDKPGEVHSGRQNLVTELHSKIPKEWGRKQSENPAKIASKNTLWPSYLKDINLERGSISLGVVGGGEDLRGLDDISRSRWSRRGMPCKQVRRDISGDAPKAVSIFRLRMVRADVDNKNLNMDVRVKPSS
jgi:hypothetical protein